jgi:hypothetical protein
MPNLNPQPLPPGARVSIKVTEAVTVEQLHALVSHIVGRTGCTTCGLLGITLELSGDPAEVRGLEKVPGVKSVEIS